MKYTLFCLLTIALLTRCGEPLPEPPQSTASFVASPDQDTAKYVPLYIHGIPPDDEINGDSTAYGGYGQQLPPPMEKMEAQLLTKNYWVIEGYADNQASGLQRIAATGQWIQCFDNGSFYGGHWDRQTHAGVWYLNYQYDYPRLILDSNVDRLDATWEMQAIAGDRSRMAWVRLAAPAFGYSHPPFSVKLIELYDRPTKEQFAGIHGGL